MLADLTTPTVSTVGPVMTVRADLTTLAVSTLVSSTTVVAHLATPTISTIGPVMTVRTLTRLTPSFAPLLTLKTTLAAVAVAVEFVFSGYFATMTL